MLKKPNAFVRDAPFGTSDAEIKTTVLVLLAGMEMDKDCVDPLPGLPLLDHTNEPFRATLAFSPHPSNAV